MRFGGENGVTWLYFDAQAVGTAYLGVWQVRWRCVERRRAGELTGRMTAAADGALLLEGRRGGRPQEATRAGPRGHPQRGARPRRHVSSGAALPQWLYAVDRTDSDALVMRLSTASSAPRVHSSPDPRFTCVGPFSSVFLQSSVTNEQALLLTDPRSAPADGTETVASVKTGGYIYSLLEREGGQALRALHAHYQISAHTPRCTFAGHRSLSTEGGFRATCWMCTWLASKRKTRARRMSLALFVSARR